LIPSVPPKKQPGKPLYKTKRQQRAAAVPADAPPADDILRHAAPVAPARFEMAADGSILTTRSAEEPPGTAPAPRLAYSDPARGLWLYHGNSLELLDAIAGRYPEGRFDAIFADPPYFLSNGGITCHAGRMVSVHKGDWDQSRGPELNHEFNLEWLRRCQRVLKPDGTIWVTGTLHVIFSVGYA
jgi:site-specific DNA-methyltransferase (adenine-specific)